MTMTMAKLSVGLDGKPIIQSWGPWGATEELRFAVPPETTTKPPRLQQRFHRHGYDSVGHVSGGEYEWRDVPRVVVP